MIPPALIKKLGIVDYQATWESMIAFTKNRTSQTADELWLLQHPPVYTQGRNSKPEHLLVMSDIPVINIDRGGQITYHAPGQWVLYLLIDLKRLGIGVRELTNRVEHGVQRLLEHYNIESTTRRDAPGVYVNQAKIAALGFRIKRGCCYHGLSLNVAMDLSPFSDINPCGYQGLTVTDLKQLGVNDSFESIGQRLVSSVHQTLFQAERSESA